MVSFQNNIHLHTVQPYLVMKTDAFCQHRMTSHGISLFYSCQYMNDTAVSFPLIPDGCSNILFAYSSNGMTAEIIGPTVEKELLTLGRNTDYFGVRFLPGENHCFANLPAKELINSTVPLLDFIKMKQLYVLMADERSFEGRMRTFIAEYEKTFVTHKKNRHELFLQICRIINNKNGMILISELEKASGYSARYINYIFEAEGGMSAKQFCRIIKLQSVISFINSGKAENMSKIAADYHFYDQSHFIHEFEQFTGKTPKAYLDEVTQKQYKKRVIDI
jgi:AraC-like DNA-binding protein